MDEKRRREAVAVCGGRQRGRAGITVWDVETGEELLRIPSCSAAPFGLLCLSDHTFVASQLSNHGTTASGSIVMWPTNKPHSPLRSYTMEAIGPLCCTRDGAFLAAGAFSGNIYLWEVGSGRLLKFWPAHRKTVKCMAFCDDGSFLISGSDDGMLCVWSMIRLLESEDSRSFSALLHCSSEHTCSITGLQFTTRGPSLTFVSSSLDGTWKAWDLVSGILVKTRVHDHPITAIALQPAGHLLFSGSIDGSIFIEAVENVTIGDSVTSGRDQIGVVLKGHNDSITALCFSRRSLISASKDCSVCVWNVESREVIRSFIHQKGPVTNLVTLPWHALFRGLDNEKCHDLDRNHVSVFEKYSRESKGVPDMITCLPLVTCNQICLEFQRNGLLQRCIDGSQLENYGVSREMKVETAMGRRSWATNMARHVVEMNKHIQTCLIDMMQLRLWHDDNDEDIEPRPLSNSMKSRRRKNYDNKGKDEEEHLSHHPVFSFE